MANSVQTNPVKPEQISDLLQNDKVTKLFSNGFTCGFSASDAHITFRYDNVTSAVVIMGMPAIKSLHSQITQLIKIYEEHTGSPIQSAEDIILKLAKLIPKQQPKP